MAYCSSEPGCNSNDYFSLYPMHTYTSYNGKHQFRNQLQSAYYNPTAGKAKITTSMNINTDPIRKLYMEGAEIGCINEPYRTLAYLPLGTEQLILRFKTLIKCSVKMHIKFIGTILASNADLDSFNDSESVLVNEVITFYDSTDYQSIILTSPEMAGKEGYFVILWANADDIQMSAVNPATEYGFTIEYDLQMTTADADTWLRTSRSYAQYSSSVDPKYNAYAGNPYLVPFLMMRTIYQTCTTAGTKCDQMGFTSSVFYRYPCSIENRQQTILTDSEIEFTLTHDNRFSESWAVDRWAHITVTDTDTSTVVMDETNLNVNEAMIGVHEYQYNITGLTSNTNHKIDISYINSAGVDQFETVETFYFTTDSLNTEVDAPRLYTIAQAKATPDRMVVYFYGVANTTSYDLYVDGLFHTNVLHIGTGSFHSVNVDGLTAGTTYLFELYVIPDAGYTAGTNSEMHRLKVGWLDDPVVTLTSTMDSVTVTYNTVPNANQYTVLLNHGLSYNGVYNSPYTINGLVQGQLYYIKVYASDTTGVYTFSEDGASIITADPVAKLDRPQVMYNNTGPVSPNAELVKFDLREPVLNAERYEVVVNGVATPWNGFSAYNATMDYGVAYTVVIKAYSDTWSLESECHPYNMTLHKKVTAIEPPREIKFAHGPNNDTDRLIVEVGFDPDRGGETLRTTVEDMSGVIVEDRTTIVATNLVLSDQFDIVVAAGAEYIVRSWFEIPKTWGGTYEAKSNEKVLKLRSLADTDGDGHADNHPTNPDRDNPNTTYGYGDGLGL